MARIEIEWLTDYKDCDQAGCSGGYAEGARVRKDGEEWITLLPRAACFGSEDDWDQQEVYRRCFNRLPQLSGRGADTLATLLARASAMTGPNRMALGAWLTLAALGGLCVWWFG